MKIKLIALLGLILFGFLGNSFAQNQNEYSFSLKQAQSFAIENNTDAKNARLDVISAQKKVWETTAIGLPQANVSLAYSHIPDVPSMQLPASFLDPTAPADAIAEIPVASENNTDITLQATQLVFSGEYLVGLQASRVFRKLSEQSLANSELTITETIQNTYIMILVAEENKLVLESTLGNIQQLAEETQAFYKEGFVEETDADQLTITASSIENSLSNLDRQIDLAYSLLKMQLGLSDEAKLVLTQRLDELMNSVNFERYILKEFQLQNNPSYQLVQTNEELMELDYKRTLSTTLPTIAAFVQHTEKTDAPELDFSPKTIVGLSVDIPVFASGKRTMQIQQAKIAHHKAQNQKDYAAQGLNVQVLKAKSDLQNALDSYNTEKQNIELSKKIYDRSKIKYKEGIMSSMDLTQAHNQYLTTQSNYFTSIMNLMNAHASLVKLIGE